MSKRRVDISVVVPIFNEQDSLPELYNRLTAAVSQVSENYEIIFVNDGSKDLSLLKIIELARSNQRIFYINFSRNFGHQIAVTAGLDFSTGDAVVIIDADLQDPPELIPELYKKHKEGFEVVYARRTQRKGETFFKKMTAKLFYRILSQITSIKIPLDTGDFRLVDRKIVDYLKLMPEQNKFLRGQIAWLGFNQTYVEFAREERKHGTTGYPLSRMIRFALDGITSFSDKPLSWVTQSGIIVSTFSLFVIIYTLYGHFILNHTVDGWASLIVSIMFIGGIQLISIGIIGLYVSRINKNVINRPLYLIQDTNFEGKKEDQA